MFLGIVLPIFYVLKTKNNKNLFLLFASYAFYGYWDWRFCGLLLLSTLVDYFVGQKLHQAQKATSKKWLLRASLASNLGILALFKYFNFFVDSFQQVVEGFGGHVDYLHLNILLPVGISFYTFQTLSYTIDIYRGKLNPTRNFIDFALFVSFFPQLVAGPIERARALLPQLSAPLHPSRNQIKEGIVLIITGLFRKVLIGDTAGRYVDHIFTNLQHFSSFEIICGLVLFSVQIYADFSGYSHMARGTAKLVGVELMKNFEQPYLSRNITEFWRRWHISLSQWLKDYLYLSLGGNRKGESRTYINLMITMLLGGLWHGASWNFMIWGGLHGIYLAIHKMSLRGKKVESSNLSSISVRSAAKMFATYLLVLFTWIFFRSTSIETTSLFFSKMINWEPSNYWMLFAGITASYVIITVIIDRLEYQLNSHTFILQLKSRGIIVGILVGLLAVSFIYMFQADPLPFIYFQF